MMRRIAVVLGIGALATQAFAESRITAVPATTTNLTATAKLNIAVNVPRILYLRVGDAGATVNTVTFNVGLGGPLSTLPQTDAVFGGSLPPSLGTTTVADDSGASDGQVPVQLWTNNGTTNLTCSGNDLTSGASSIPKSDVSVTSSAGGSLAHPGASLACTSAARGVAGVNALSDTWTYAFAPVAMPPAGNYQTQITYTASQP